METKLNWNLLSKYRNELYGISILMVMALHYCRDWVFQHVNMEMPFVINVLGMITNIGVPIFLILSGMGLYFSFVKNSNIKDFYSKRMTRIFIPYIIIYPVFWVLRDLVIEKSILKFFLDFTTLSLWLNGTETVWYFAFIIVMYAIYPLVYKVITIESQTKKNIIFFTLLLISFLFPIWLHNVNPNYYNFIEIAITRIPIFLIGCYVAKYIYEKKSINFLIIGAVLLSCAIFYTLDSYYGEMYSRYFFSMVSILCCIIFALMLNFIKSANVNKILFFLGTLSLELYFTHAILRNFLKFVTRNYTHYNYSAVLYTIVMLFALLASVISCKIGAKIINLFQNPKLKIELVSN